MFDFLNANKKKIDISGLRQKAKENDVDAQYELSLAYYRGIYVPKNLEKSSYWFQKANDHSNNRHV